MHDRKRIAPAIATHADTFPLALPGWIVYAPDKGDGDPTPTPGQEPETPAEQPANEKPETPATGLDALPEWAQVEIRNLRGEAAKHRTAKAAAQRAADEAEEKRLADEKQFQALAEKRQGQIAELEPKAALADALTEKIRAQIEAEIAGWPDEVTALLGAGDAENPVPVLELLERVEKARPLAARLKTPETPAPGNSPRPQPTGQGERGRNEQLRRTQRDFVRSRF